MSEHPVWGTAINPFPATLIVTVPYIVQLRKPASLIRHPVISEVLDTYLYGILCASEYSRTVRSCLVGHIVFNRDQIDKFIHLMSVCF